jgi:hypothetical protein
MRTPNRRAPKPSGCTPARDRSRYLRKAVSMPDNLRKYHGPPPQSETFVELQMLMPLMLLMRFRPRMGRGFRSAGTRWEPQEGTGAQVSVPAGGEAFVQIQSCFDIGRSGACVSVPAWGEAFVQMHRKNARQPFIFGVSVPAWGEAFVQMLQPNWDREREKNSFRPRMGRGFRSDANS